MTAILMTLLFRNNNHVPQKKGNELQNTRAGYHNDQPDFM